MSDTEQTPNTETPKPADNPQPTTPSVTQGASEPTFTQADIDRIITDRLKRDREAQQAKLLESLGVTSLEDAKTALETKRKADEAAMSELEKAQAEIEKARKQAQEAMQAKTALEQQILADKRKNAFLKAATENGGGQVDDLFILVTAKHGNDFSSVFGEDATPDDAKMKAFIKQVQASFPAYFGVAGAGSPSNANGVAPNSRNTEDLEKQLKKKFGKL